MSPFPKPVHPLEDERRTSRVREIGLERDPWRGLWQFLEGTSESHGMEVLWHEPLADHTTFRIGGAVRCLVRPQTVEGVADLLRRVRSMDVPLVVLGGGSNVLAPDEPMEGVVLQLNRACAELRVEGPGERGVVEVYVGAGVRSARLMRFSLENQLSGAEFLVGIPGTVGGAAVMNAGTPEGSLADVLLWIELLNERGEKERVRRRDLQPEYRCMGLPAHWTVVGVCLGLKRATKGHDLRHKLREDMKRRKGSQPLEWPSAGSVYKNPPEAPAGYLIEKAGLKGFSVGGACVSPKHANWIVNLGGAKSSDVRALMSHIEKKVLLEFGVCLQREILIL